MSDILTYAAFGHSHVVALAKGAYALETKQARAGATLTTGRFHYLYDAGYVPEVQVGPDGAVLHPAIVQALDAGPDVVILSIGGNEHNVLSIAQASPQFDFVLGSAPTLALDRHADIIPESVLRETLRDWMGVKIDTMREIRKATKAPVIQAEPPPPLPREQVLAYPKEFFQKTLSLRKVSPDLLRYKMWRLQTELYREMCAEIGVDYVATPPEFVAPDGMLVRSAWATDATHANELFGERMMQDVFALARQRLAERVAT